MSTSPTSPVSLASRAITWSIVLSVLLILVGLFAILVPPLSGIAVTLFIGWTMVVSGITHFIYAFKTHTTGSLLWELLLGALYLFSGAYLLFHPLSALISLTLLLAVYLLLEGIFEIVHAFQVRPRHGYLWLIFDGIVTLLLAIMIWRAWPSSSVWAIGTLIGISMLFSGFSRLMLSLAAKKALTQTT